MTNPTTLETLTAELAAAKTKLNELQAWLKTHTQHRDFLLIASDRNHCSVRVDRLKFKVNQLERGLPILGQPEELKGSSVNLTTIEIEKLHHTLIR